MAKASVVAARQEQRLATIERKLDLLLEKAGIKVKPESEEPIKPVKLSQSTVLPPAPVKPEAEE